jgi:hypothetical protein
VICPTCGRPQLTEHPHRHPPTRPQPPLIDDGYLVEPEPIDPRVPDTNSTRYSDEPPRPPPLGCVHLVLGICIGVWLAALVLLGSIVADPVPSSAPDPTVVVPRDLSGLLADASGPELSGAPQEREGGIASPMDRHDGGAPQPMQDGFANQPAHSGEVGTGGLLGGWATWHDNGAGLYAAAGPELRRALGPGWRGTVVDVTGPGGLVVRVPLTDSCACGERHGLPTFLDLSADAFAELAPLGWGIVAVSVELPGQLPATDTEGDPS